MAYDEGLADRIRDVLPKALPVTERKMFGGLAFMLNGNMSCGIVGDRLMVRVHPDRYEAALAEPHVGPMDFTGRPMRGFVYVDGAGIAEEQALRDWVGRGLDYAASLPPK